MKVGDLVVTDFPCRVSNVIDPTPSRPGRTRWWPSGQPALITDFGYRMNGSVSIKKIRVLLDGELWWVGGGQIVLFGDANESR